MTFGTSIRIKRAATARVGDGDRAAWHARASALYEELRRPATGLIRRAYGSAFADDEIHDIYSSAWLGTLRALEPRHHEMEDGEIRSYVLTAVANHASKELRRRRRKPVAPLEAAGAVAATADGPEDPATAQESTQMARDLIASLPPRRRAVMLLRYGWGLDPSEVCEIVEGLSARAYRKEITRGVDELTKKIKLVEEGRWCAEREPLLKAFASGLADKDQVLQAEHHLAHCRQCHEFVGRLTGHLHDFGSAVLIPGAFEAADSNYTLLERLSAVTERVREAVSRSDPSEAIASVTSARGAGAASAGVVAKLAGLGTAGKVALACLSGGAAATACVAAGIGPVSIGDGPAPPAQAAFELGSGEGANRPPRGPQPVTTGEGAPQDASSDADRQAAQREVAPESQPALAPETPPIQQEFGVESTVAPAPTETTTDGGNQIGTGSTAAQQEFGP